MRDVSALACSIVIPTHNRPHLLRRAVLSALAGSAGAEVLVVDDASTVPARDTLSDIADSRLRVVRNGAGRGAAPARNFGVAEAQGATIFFLDDDDELIPGYCSRILSGPVAQGVADWGFAQIRLRVVGQDGQSMNENPIRRPRNARGVVPDGAPLRAKIASASAGFWIRRETFINAGGFDPQLVVDEDTDLCVWLVTSGNRPWFDTEPGTIVYRNDTAQTGEQPHLTSPSQAARAAVSYLRTYTKAEPLFPTFSEAHWFLASRYIRRSVKAGLVEDARDFCRSRTPLPFRMALSTYLIFKKISLRLKKG